MKPMISSFLFSCMLFCMPFTSMAEIHVGHIMTEYAETPLGIDVRQPRFSWQISASDERGVVQQSYQISVRNEAGQEVWNSGRIADSRSLNITYAGKSLASCTRYQYTVNVWTNKGYATSSSWFETGLMSDREDSPAWDGAQWIGGNQDSHTFYSQYFPVFRLCCRLQLDKKSKSTHASFIYGANDLRLMDADKNILGVKNAPNQSYIKVELNISDAAHISIYRSGYTKKDIATQPHVTFAIPAALLIGNKRYASHEIMLSSVVGATEIAMDGVILGKTTLNPMGNNGDFIAFPVVGDIGFSTDPGQEAHFEELSVRNYRSPYAVLSKSFPCTLTGETKIFTPQETGTTMLRTHFASNRNISKARLYTSALGTYDISINGKRISDDYLNPGLTQYNKTLFYQTYDVTPFLMQGDNQLIAQLNEGWFSGWLSYDASNWNYFGDRQALIAKLDITYTDGTHQTVITHPQQWQFSTQGPVKYASIFQGEVYDARQSNTEASAWLPAQEVIIDSIKTKGEQSAPLGSNGVWPATDDWSHHRLIAQLGKPVRPFTTLTARKMNEVRPGVYVYDMQQNMPGIPSITFHNLRPGQRVLIRLAEVRYPDLPAYQGNTGMIMMENIRAAMAQDIYIAKGGTEETYQPRYTYHGFQFVEITGIDSPVPVNDVKGVVLSTIDQFTADYTTSDSTLNRFFENVKWSSLANVFSVPTDCPQRNERMGWSGDLSVFSPTMSYMFNGAQFLRRHLQALRDTQLPQGEFPPIAPIGGGFGGPLWQSVGIVMPWQSYLQYQDMDALREHYPAMKSYMEMVNHQYIDVEKHYYKGTSTWSDLGDWLGFENNKNDNTLIFDCYYAYELELMTRMAKALGNTTDAQLWEQRRTERIQFINAHNFDSTGMTIGNGLGTLSQSWTGNIGTFPKGKKIDTQTSYAVALALGIVAPEQEANVVKHLVNTVTRENTGDDGKTYPSYSLMTGFVGTPWISLALGDHGHVAEAYQMLLNHDYPSWLYPVDQGATTIWERLNSMTKTDGFGGNNHMNSFNHYAFGSVTNWLMQRSLGIARDVESPGFKHFFLCPQVDPAGKLTSVHGYYDSMYGRIESSWQQQAGKTHYHFVIPANTTATLILPGMKKRELKSGSYDF